ncbi:serine hydrolase [Steroidobacter agaridevorans]|uniref:Serine hydrolase n=1 Tax=Steroidobacter agaridevorans TaxID=2695856 RepID=A0A829YEL3_9GAMM|nr:serine hydrolase domain-containing protein [Steroidobacter agaridevorans]GFE81727.1 serine hydrolase [Steroidobacter agaridevorans]GFE90471.1 serine hydrolase [Steroidobacter agaridevorans]
MRTRLITTTLLAALLGSASFAETPQTESWNALNGARSQVSAATSVSKERLARIDTLMQQYVDENLIAGAVALVLQNGQLVYQHAAGWADKEAGTRMSTDTIFRIASQTKALTSAAVLQLQEQGKLVVTDPVSKYIPEFARTTVMVNGSAVPAKRPITLRDLLTHTAGISYGTNPEIAALYKEKGLGPAAGMGWYTADKNEPICTSMEKLGSLPFVAQPGEAWVYGYNTDILGCVVERASGMALDEYLRKNITQPLGMKDTNFFLPKEQRSRLAAVYGTGTNGKIARSANDAKGQGHYVDGPRRSFAGGAGLLSTAADYARFLEALRNGGALGNARILSPRSVALMTTNQIGDIYNKPDMGFGFGFETVERFGASGLEAPGAFGWGGAYGTNYRVDPTSGLVVVLMIQLMPNGTDFREKFASIVYQSLLPQQ